MEYVSEILDRSTGDLKQVPMGDWITVTELGERYGVGPKQVRAILHHIGLLGVEGRRYRLTRHAVEKGLGKRIDKAQRSKFPFDVVSPSGQRLVADAWDAAVADLRASDAEDPIAVHAAEALATFKSHRRGDMTTQEEVCWLRDHFLSLTHERIADLLNVTRPLVTRYATTQDEQRTFARRRITADLPPGRDPGTPTDSLSALAEITGRCPSQHR